MCCGRAFRAELMPDDKVSVIREMTAKGGVVIVGDGINDAPALAWASVGIAMRSGSDVALETADGALLRNRVSDVAAMVRLARAAMGNIRQNVTITLGMKAVFLVTTILGITGLWLAILADTGQPFWSHSMHYGCWPLPPSGNSQLHHDLWGFIPRASIR